MSLSNDTVKCRIKEMSTDIADLSKLLKLCQGIGCHLEQLRSELIHYFPHMACCAYFTNPFPVNPTLLPVGTEEQKDIIDIQSDKTAKTTHKESSPINFCRSMASTYEILARNAIPQLLVFPSSLHGSVSRDSLPWWASKPRVEIALKLLDTISNALWAQLHRA